MPYISATMESEIVSGSTAGPVAVYVSLERKQHAHVGVLVGLIGNENLPACTSPAYFQLFHEAMQARSRQSHANAMDQNFLAFIRYMEIEFDGHTLAPCSTQSGRQARPVQLPLLILLYHGPEGGWARKPIPK